MGNSLYKKIMRYLKIILVNFLVLILLLIIGELSIRVIRPNFRLYQRSNPNVYKDRAFDKNYTKVNWPQKDTDLGWVCKQDSLLKFYSKYYNQFRIKYYINKEGFRNKNDFESKSNPNYKSNILLLGDSFIFSIYLDEYKTVASNLQKRFAGLFNIINLGIPGFGIDQCVISYEKYSKLIDPKIVVLVYIDDDITRNLEAFRKDEGMNKPSYDIINDSLQIRINSKSSFLTNLFENSYLFNRFYKKYMDYYSIKLAEKIFHKLIVMTRANGQKLIIMRLPILEALLSHNRNEFYSFSDFFKKEKIDYYEFYDKMISMPKDYLKTLYLKNDGHPSEIGAKYFSELIFNILSTTLKYE
jgi:hypothetical protein